MYGFSINSIMIVAFLSVCEWERVFIIEKAWGRMVDKYQAHTNLYYSTNMGAYISDQKLYLRNAY